MTRPLALGRASASGPVLVVVNNDGGGIFSTLEQAPSRLLRADFGTHGAGCSIWRRPSACLSASRTAGDLAKGCRHGLEDDRGQTDRARALRCGRLRDAATQAIRSLP